MPFTAEIDSEFKWHIEAKILAHFRSSTPRKIMYAEPRFLNEHAYFVKSNFTGIGTFESDPRVQSQVMDREKNSQDKWLKIRVKWTINEYVSVERAHASPLYRWERVASIAISGPNFAVFTVDVNFGTHVLGDLACVTNSF
jgi:hypothetical protein